MEKDSVEKLLEIQKLKEAGVLNEEEFEEQKKRILEEDNNAPQKPVVKTRSLYSGLLNLWSKLHSSFRLDQKKQEELSTNKLALFVLLINIVSFIGIIMLMSQRVVVSSMMTFFVALGHLEVQQQDFDLYYGNPYGFACYGIVLYHRFLSN